MVPSTASSASWLRYSGLLRLSAVHCPLPCRRGLLLRRRDCRGHGLRSGGRLIVLRRVGGMGRDDGASLHGHERGACLGGSLGGSDS
jgi:hypothetical protein